MKAVLFTALFCFSLLGLAATKKWPPPKPAPEPIPGITISPEERQAILDLFAKQNEMIDGLKAKIEALQNGTGCT